MISHGSSVVSKQALDGSLEVEVVQHLLCKQPTHAVEEVGVFNVDDLRNVAFCQLPVAKSHCQSKIDFKL